MVQDVSLDDAVEKLTSNKAKFAVDGCGGSTYVVPAAAGVMGKSRVSVLKESDCHCRC